MWASADSAEKRLGVRNVGGLKGCIEDFELADTLIGLQLGQKTGILRIELGDIIRKIYVRGGDMIFSSSNYFHDYLSQMLLRYGKITRKQHDYVVEEMKRTNERLGRVLVSKGILTPREVFEGVRKQIEEIILNLFILEEAVFAVEEMSTLPSDELITLKLSTGNIIYQGLKRINNMKRVLNELPHHDSILTLSPNPLDLFQDIRLDAIGSKLLSGIDNNTSLNDVLSDSQLDDHETLKTILALINTRLIVTADKSEALDGVSREDIKDMLEEETDYETLNMIDEIHTRLESHGYYGVLGLQEKASLPEIRKAYYSAAKKYHPDIHFRLEDASYKGKLSQIFSYVYEAYATLSDPAKREKYDKSLGKGPTESDSPAKNAKKKFDEGKQLFNRNKFADAELFFAQATYTDGSKAIYHYYHGMALHRQSRHRDAIKVFERPIKLEPFNADYVAELGRVYLKLNLTSLARISFEKALKLSPTNLKAYMGIETIKAG
jgi:curved DNA-binding protein CbpA